FVREGHPVNFFLAMFISAGVAAIFGVLLGAPTLRLRGDYLAIVTLGFGEIVPLVVKNTPEVTKGTQGMNPIGFPEVPGVLFAVDRILFDWISGIVHGIGAAIGNQDLELTDVSRSRQLIFGIALVFMMLVRPEGLFPSARRRAELHAAEELGEVAAEQERAVFVEVEN